MVEVVQGKQDSESSYHLALNSVLQEFVEAIDAIDNGISQYPADLQPQYRSRTDVSSRVGHLNPPWNEHVDSAGVDVSTCLAALSPYNFLHTTT